MPLESELSNVTTVVMIEVQIDSQQVQDTLANDGSYQFQRAESAGV